MIRFTYTTCDYFLLTFFVDLVFLATFFGALDGLAVFFSFLSSDFSKFLNSKRFINTKIPKICVYCNADMPKMGLKP